MKSTHGWVVVAEDGEALVYTVAPTERNSQCRVSSLWWDCHPEACVAQVDIIPSEPCVWGKDDNDYWVSGCGRVWDFDCKEMVYCPFCRQPIETR